MKKLSLKALLLSFVLLFSATGFADTFSVITEPPPPPPPPVEDPVDPQPAPEPVEVPGKPGKPTQYSKGVWDG